MLLPHLAILLTLLSLLCEGTPPPKRGPIARTQGKLVRPADGLARRQAAGANSAIRKRQTTREQVVRRATRRLTAPRALTSSSPCGWSGPFLMQRDDPRFAARPFVGTDTATGANAWGMKYGFERDQAIRFTFDSSCRVVASDRTLNGRGGTTSNNPFQLFLDTATRLAAADQMLRCRVTAETRLACTRFATNTPGVFCAGAVGNAELLFGNTCGTNFAGSTFTVVEP